ncbi:MAG TPA: transposase, partial [Trebonia sp.]
MSYLPGMMTARDGSDSRAAPCVRRWPGAGGLAGSHPGVAVARFEVPDGWTVQAFTFALDCTPGQAACVRRQFGGRRYARNWAVRTLKDDIARYRETGEAWWPEISKEAFADGVRAAVDGYWNWQASRAGTRQGRRVGFPRFAKKGRDRVPNPRPLEAALKELRHLCRERSRRARGSRRYAETSRRITRLQRRVADIRACHVHRLTTRLAKTHGAIVAEGLDAAGMLAQKGLTGARARRRGLSDSA